MLLKDIIAALPGDIVLSGDAEREILGIAYDSRQVKEGYLFVAIPGLQVDGHDFIPQAVANGACAVIAERRLPLPVPLIVTADSRRALAFAAAAWYGYPDRQLRLIGVAAASLCPYCFHLRMRKKYEKISGLIYSSMDLFS